MPSIIDQAQQAGFSKDEISTWATGFRDQAKAAGFSDDEVTSYLGDTVTPPTTPPQSFLRRLSGPNMGDRITAAMGKGAAEGWGSAPLGEDTLAAMRKYGMISDPAQGQPGPIRLLTDAINKPIGIAADAISRAPGAIIMGLGAGVGQVAKEAGASETTQGQIEREAENFAMFLGAGGDVVPKFTRPEIDVTGAVRDAPIGGLPKGEDFANAAKAVVGTAPQSVQQKLLRLYTEKGLLPGEVAADAASDPLVTQALASAGTDLPERYQGEMPLASAPEPAGEPKAAPAAPVAANEPPPPGAAPGERRLADVVQQAYGITPTEGARAEVRPNPIEGFDIVTPEGVMYADTREQADRIAAQANRNWSPAAANEPENAPPQGLETGVPPPSIPSGDFANEVRSFRPGDLSVDARRFQFKEGADEAGVSERLRGIDTWDPIKAGLGLVWEDENGRNWIVDGHQRMGLAQRISEADPTQDPRINAIVVRATDGVSDAEARVMAASKNIAEGTGTALDAARVLRDRPDLVKELPPRSELVRQARGLAELGDDPFRMVVNDVVPPNYASIVGRLAPGDDKIQGALLELLNKTDPQNAIQAESIVRQGIDAGTRTETQASLFGDQQQISSLYLDRARVLDRTMRDLKRDRTVFSTIVRDQDVISAVGNQLESTENAKRLAIDQQAVQILQTLANRRGPLSDALTAAARTAAGGDRAGAAREFADFLRGQIESGDLVRAADSLERGRADVGRQDASSVIDPDAASPSVEAEQRAAADSGAIVKQTVERTAQGPQLVIPGTEQSARQAAQAREAEGRGRITPPVAQEAAGGMFAEPAAEEPELRFGPETGAIYFGPAAKPPAPGSLEEARQSILSKVSIGQGSPRRPWTLSRIYTDVFDKLYPISAARDTVRMATLDPYKLTRNLAGEAGKIDHFLTAGTLDFETRAINGPSLEAVLAPVKDDLDNFRAFAIAARGLELEANGITTGLDSAAMQNVVRNGIAKYEPTLTALVEYQNRVAAYLRDAGVLSREGYDAMTEKYPLYVPYQRVMEPEYRGSGGAGSLQATNPLARILGSEREIIDPIESIIRNTANMVMMADRNEAGNALINMLTAQNEVGIGARRPIEALTLPPNPELDAALRDFLERNGVPRPDNLLDLLHAAASPPEARGTIGVFRNGTRYAYRVDPELADAWKGLDSQSAGAIEKLFRPFASVLRAGAVLTPDFALRHSIRDFLYAAVTSTRGVFTPADMARGFIGQITKNDAYWRWVQGGGANISMVTIDRRYLQESIDRLTENTGLMTRAQNVVADPNASWMEKAGAVAGLPLRAAGKYLLHPLQVMTTLAENATHLGAFIKEERRLGALGITGREAIQEAAFVSRDIAVDAARIGAKTRAYNMITAFANITLQDGDRVVRAFVNDPVGTSIKIGAGISLPSALLWWAQHDDPRYHEIPQWERDLFWIVMTDKWEDAGPAEQFGPPNPRSPYRVVGDRLQVNNGPIFRVPKPWGMGVLFGSGVERSLEAFAADNPEAFRHWGDSIAAVSIPSFVPTAVSPILNQWTNRDTFTNRTLIPDQMEKFLPEYQYTPYTTEAAKALGKLMGAFPGLRNASIMQDSPFAGGVARALSSPILIENYIRGWSGTLGMYALQLADAALRKQGILPDPPTPTAALADIPVVRAFVIRYPTATTQSIQDFQDAYRANRVYYDTWLAKAKEGDMAAAQRVQQLGGPMMFIQLDQIEKTLEQHNRQIRDIYKNPQMSPSDKRQLIDTTYFRMIELGQYGKAALSRINATLH